MEQAEDNAAAMITLGRLALHLAPGSAPGRQAFLRRQAASALGYADLAPHALPPRAVLVVRQLADPLPGDLLRGHPWQAGDRWGEGARAEVTRLWRSAARPAHGPVPPDAQAVWFADQVEWLACLSIDIHHGVAHLRWWWHTRLAAASASRVAAPGGPARLSDLWRAAAPALPATLAYLHKRSPIRVAALLEKLPPPERQAVLRAVLGAHALPETLLDQPIPRETWRRWIHNPEGISSPAPGVEAAAALLLAAWYAPVALRHYAGQGISPAHGDAAPTAPEGVEPPAAKPAPMLASEEDYKTPGKGPDPQTKQAEALHENLERSPIVTSTTTRMPESAAFFPPAQKWRQEWVPEQAAAEAAPPTTAPSKPTNEPAPATIAQEAAQDHGLATGLGGVWLLINVLLALDQMEGEISPWLKLEALARHLLAKPPEDDPLWEALTELAGSERTAPALEQAGEWLVEAWARIEAWLLEKLEILEALILEQRATCYLTPTHIDVVFALEDISLPLRLAGLDRDPGWVPELARAIQFHFE